MPPSLRRARKEKAAPQRSDGGTKEERDVRPRLAIAERRARPKASVSVVPGGTSFFAPLLSTRTGQLSLSPSRDKSLATASDFANSISEGWNVPSRFVGHVAAKNRAHFRPKSPRARLGSVGGRPGFIIVVFVTVRDLGLDRICQT